MIQAKRSILRGAKITLMDAFGWQNSLGVGGNTVSMKRRAVLRLGLNRLYVGCRREFRIFYLIPVHENYPDVFDRG